MRRCRGVPEVDLILSRFCCGSFVTGIVVHLADDRMRERRDTSRTGGLREATRDSALYRRHDGIGSIKLNGIANR
jgi:hypothetical protein